MDKQHEYLFCGEWNHRVDTMVCEINECKHLSEVDGDKVCGWKPTGKKKAKRVIKKKLEGDTQ